MLRLSPRGETAFPMSEKKSFSPNVVNRGARQALRLHFTSISVIWPITASIHCPLFPFASKLRMTQRARIGSSHMMFSSVGAEGSSPPLSLIRCEAVEKAIAAGRNQIWLCAPTGSVCRIP